MKKYSRILLVAVLTVLLVSVFAFSVNAATYTIKSAADFKTYLYDSSLWGGNHTYNITVDSITLTGTQTPIGNNSTPFKGTINGDADGNGTPCTISGINISTSTAYTGFFGAAANSTFNDLILKGSVKSTYKGTDSEHNGIVGGLLGRSRGNLNVNNVASHLTVTSSGSAVGGIVGQVCMNTSGCAIRIEASSNQGEINGFKHVGGIVGRVGGADATHSLKGTVTIHNCKNTAKVTGTDNVAGGILGYFDYRNTTDLGTLNVTYCSNTGAVTGGNYVGGIVGLYLATTQKYNAALKMKVLHNRGVVEATSGDYHGAIVGFIYAPILNSSTNKPANMFTLEDWQHVGLDKEEALIGFIGKPGSGQSAAEITVLRAYNMVGKQILRTKDTISGTVAFNSNNVTLNTCRNVNSSESAMASLDSSSDLWVNNSATGTVTLAAYSHASHTYSSSSPCYCTFCGKGETHAYSGYVWKYDSTAKIYHITCVCGKVYKEQIAAPIVYVGTSGSDSKDGLSRTNRVLTLKEAVKRLANVGGTVAICGQISIDADITFPAWSNTITFTVDKSSGNTSYNSGGYVQAGLLIKEQDVQLQLKGKAIFDDILFKANDSTNHRVIISANWYNLEMKHIRAVNNATCYIVAGTYGETADSTNLTTTKNTSIKIDGPSLTDSFSSSVGYFYERVILGSAPLETVTVKNKTVTLTVQDGYTTSSSTVRTEPALIYFLYAMSTADRIQTVYTENCTSNVYLNDNSMVHAFSTGSHNVGSATTETFVNPDGTEETVTFTDGNAYLDKLNFYFNDNSNITDGLRADGKALNKPDAISGDKVFENLGRFYVLNTKNTVIKISDEDGIDEYSGEGTRTTPIYHNLYFYRNGTFDSASVTATIKAEFGRHGFLSNFGDKTLYNNGPAHDVNDYAYTLTQDIDPECVWNEGVITTAPTPSKAGVKKFTCTICGRTKTEPVYHEHVYVVKKDGTYYCYDFVNNKVWTECNLVEPETSVVVAAVSVTHCKTATVDVTLTATGAIAASVFKVDAPAGFVLTGATTNLPATDSGTGLTVTASEAMPSTVMVVRNPVTDAVVEKTTVVTLTFDVSSVPIDDTKSHIVKVYDVESYNTAGTGIASTAVSAEVVVAHKSALTPAVSATCTTTGLTQGEHCSVCNEVLVAQETVAELGHTWGEYADNGNGTHTRTCNLDDDSQTEDCTWVGEVTSNPTATNAGVKTYTCTVCKAQYTETIDYLLNENVSFGLRVALYSEYVLEYLIAKDFEVEDCWMVFTKVDEDGNETQTKVYPTDVASLDENQGMYNDSKYYFEAPGISAKEMADVIKGDFYYVVDGVLYKSKTRSINLVSYYRLVGMQNPLGNTTGGEALVKLLDAMFNYGAAAQSYFDYNAEKLVTDYTNGNVVDYATDTDAIDEIDNSVEGLGLNDIQINDNGAESIQFTLEGQFALLEQSITTVLRFAVKDAATLDDACAYSFKGSYVNVTGMRVDFEASKIVATEGGLLVYIDRPAAKDLRVEFSGAIYKGETQVSPTVTTSLEIYAAEIINTDTANLIAKGIVSTQTKATQLKAVCRAMLAYSDAAADYFNITSSDNG